VDAPDQAYPDGQVADAAVAALKGFSPSDRRARFFLAVGIRKPHLPLTGPKRYWDLHDLGKIPPLTNAAAPRGALALALHDSVELRRYTAASTAPRLDADQVARLRRGYYAAATFADAQIGRVLDALESTGLARNTIVIVWGDHGFHLGEHGLWTKTTNYEADTRVPLIVATPDGRPRGVHTSALVELLNVSPSLVELCDLPASEKLEGRGFAANLGHPAAPGRAGALSPFPRPWVSGKNLRPEFMGYTVRTATHRAVGWPTRPSSPASFKPTAATTSSKRENPRTFPARPAACMNSPRCCQHCHAPVSAPSTQSPCRPTPSLSAA
jgi:arylsulfatase A-like enzyme